LFKNEEETMPVLDFIISSQNVVTSTGIRPAALGIRSGVISGVMNPDQIPSDVPIENFGNAVIMPGVVDTHVHINEPGRSEWEGFETATKAAAAGGITTLVDMPLNSTPVTTTLDAFRKKTSATEGKLWVDCGFYGGVIPGNNSSIQPLLDAGVLGMKAFLAHSGIDDFPNVTATDLRTAMPFIGRSGLPLLVHCELANNNSQSAIRNSKSYREYLSSRPRDWEHRAIELMISLCKEFNCRTHIVHVSSSDAIPMLRRARKEELPLTTETCPHYLFFCAEEISDGDTRFKCAPPIRERENKEKLWVALHDGVIDFIVSDHSPSHPVLKCLETGDFTNAWGGIASLQFGLSIIWTEARRRGYSVVDIARWMCTRPAEFIGMNTRKGVITPGADADVVVWNPERSFTVEPSLIQYRHKITPYEGKTLYGKIEATFLGGKKIFENGTINNQPYGKILYH
jgi:allantoinase